MSAHLPSILDASPHRLHHGEAVAERYRTAWLADASTAVVIVLPDLSVVWANTQARQMEQAGLISLEAGNLSIRDPSTTAALQSFVRSLPTNPSAWVAHELDGGYLLVRGEATEPAGWPAGMALTFRATSTSEDYILWADMSDALGLTKAEVIIVKRLLSGDRAEDIAANTPVTLETVRTHIRRIYLKLGVGTREQLFAKVLPFRLG